MALFNIIASWSIGASNKIIIMALHLALKKDDLKKNIYTIINIGIYTRITNQDNKKGFFNIARIITILN